MQNNRGIQNQTNQPEHNIQCTFCKKRPIRGFLYACTTRKNVTLCDGCFHSRRAEKGLLEDGFHAFFYPNCLDHQIPPKKKFEHKVKCNACSKKPIIGKRYQCKTKSYNMCETCFPLRSQFQMLNHNWDILIAPGLVSSNYKEKGIIPIHKVKCKGCSKYPLYGKRFKCETKKNVNLCQPCFNDRERLLLYGENWIVYHRPKMIESRIHEYLARHKGVFCNYCRVNPIKGTRYYCQTRQNFDLCSRCFSRREGIRMKNHNWTVYSAPNLIEKEIKEQNLVLHLKYRCDKCKVFPIYGPRYEGKTTKKPCNLCHQCFLARHEIKLKGVDWLVWAAPGIPVQNIYERLNKFPGKQCKVCKKKTLYGRIFVCLPKSLGVVICETCFPRRMEMGYSNMNWIVYRAPKVELERVYEVQGVWEKKQCKVCKIKPIHGRLHRCEKKKIDLCAACFSKRASPRLGMGGLCWKVFPVPGHSVPEIVDEQVHTHKNVVCNKCVARNGKDAVKNYIVGPRFKCLSHIDFDLCSICFARRHEYGMFYDHIWCQVSKHGSFGTIIHPPPKPVNNNNNNRQVPQPQQPEQLLPQPQLPINNISSPVQQPPSQPSQQGFVEYNRTIHGEEDEEEEGEEEEIIQEPVVLDPDLEEEEEEEEERRRGIGIGGSFDEQLVPEPSPPPSLDQSQQKPFSAMNQQTFQVINQESSEGNNNELNTPPPMMDVLVSQGRMLDPSARENF